MNQMMVGCSNAYADGLIVRAEAESVASGSSARVLRRQPLAGLVPVVGARLPLATACTARKACLLSNENRLFSAEIGKWPKAN